MILRTPINCILTHTAGTTHHQSNTLIIIYIILSCILYFLTINQMNISIVGTGVIGTLYGWALSNVHTITHYVRKFAIPLPPPRHCCFRLVVRYT